MGNRFLVSGYLRTGKDSLYLDFKGSRKFRWLIYRRPKITKQFIIDDTVQRVAFADSLKRETKRQYPQLNLYNDSSKDTPIQDLQGLTPRDLYIKIAKEKRDIDPDYWVKESHKNFPRGSVMVTDHRYPNEYEYLHRLYPDITTIRVFRKEVPIPPFTMTSEHQLDNFYTDFVLVSSEEDFVELTNILPQYSTYNRLDKDD